MLKEMFIDDVKSAGLDLREVSLPVLMTFDGKVYSIWFTVDYRQMNKQPRLFIDSVFCKEVNSDNDGHLLKAQIDVDVELGAGDGMTPEMSERISEELDSFGSWIDSLDEEEIAYTDDPNEKLIEILHRSEESGMRLTVDEYLEVCDSICDEFLRDGEFGDKGIFGDMTENTANNLLSGLIGVVESVIIADVYKHIQEMVYSSIQ